jgi:formylglycine-generating enzyme required for sulfatase activity
MDRDALDDANTYLSLPPQEKRSLALELARALGAGWAAGDGDVPSLLNQPTGVEFVIVPGGAFDMGLTESDVWAVKESLGWEPDISETLSDAQAQVSPSRRVRVPAFLAARDPLGHTDVERLTAGRHAGIYAYELARTEALSLAREVGLRLPSEAEYEWLMREAGTASFAFDAVRRMKSDGNNTELWTTCFGVRRPFATCWCADDFHDSYEGAPLSAEPWMNGDSCGLARPSGAEPELVDEPAQALGLLACWRTARGHRSARVRFAKDLPFGVRGD